MDSTYHTLPDFGMDDFQSNTHLHSQAWTLSHRYGDEWDRLHNYHRANDAPFDQSMTCTGPSESMQRYLRHVDRPLFVPGPVEKYSTTHISSSPEDVIPNYPIASPYTYAFPQRLSSPSTSGPSSSYMSSDMSERHSTPWSSPGPSYPIGSPKMTYGDRFPHGSGGPCIDDSEYSRDESCVALTDVQVYADAQVDNNYEEDQTLFYGSYAQNAQEGYQPMPELDHRFASHQIPEGTHANEDNFMDDIPHLRRRRVQRTQSDTSPRTTSKVTKRPSAAKRSSTYHSKPLPVRRNSTENCSSKRLFPCPLAQYGCASTFGTKNEWKRHVNTQHMRLGFWRCDQCNKGEHKPNDFNRKDLFIQHIRRMHPASKLKTARPVKVVNGAKQSKSDPEEQALIVKAEQCFRKTRSPPKQSGCLFCEASFNGESSWDERLEHIGKHLEGAKKESNEPIDPRDWQIDSLLEEWLTHEEIIIDSGKGWILADGRACGTLF